MEEKQSTSVKRFLSTERGKTKPESIEVPAISLPKGGGAVKGIDEKFSVNPTNGTAGFTIPLPFSEARGFSPEIQLSYDSGSGNGVFGLGWNLNLPSIRRKTANGLPKYHDDSEDTFLFSGAEDLVPQFKKNEKGSFIKDKKGNYQYDDLSSDDGDYEIRRYRPRIEGLFSRIEKWTHKTSRIIKWKLTNPENQTTLLGWSEASRIADPKDKTRIFEWLPEFAFDNRGNCIYYIYKKEDVKGLDTTSLHNKNRFQQSELKYTNVYLKHIFYGNQTAFKGFGNPFPSQSDYLFSTTFDFGEHDEKQPEKQVRDWSFRSDAFSDYRAGFEIRTTRLCQRVLLFHHFKGNGEYDGLVKSVALNYDTNREQGFTFLKSYTSKGHIKKTDGTYSTKQLPPIDFEYQQIEWNKEVEEVNPEALHQAPSGLGDDRYSLTDLFNEGVSGILTEQADAWYYKSNLGGGKFADAQLVAQKPSISGLGSTVRLMDLEGNGTNQLVSYADEHPGFFDMMSDQDWKPFQAFDQMPNIDLSDQNTRMLDLNGDGRADVLITEDHALKWYPSKGKQGYESAIKEPNALDEEAGPRIVFAEQTQTIFLADMSGDGLTDLVRIRNGEVSYWPNLGHGRFGAKVSMDQAPVFDTPDKFNPAFIQLTDIDGSGTADIIYLGKQQYTCWRNLNGNAFAKQPFVIDSFPQLDQSSKVSVTDLLGSGTACIIWSSALPAHSTAPLRYIDLMKSKKPHVLIGYKNNMGREVSVQYKASTHYYLADKKAGKPWLTKLPFPVHCVAQTTSVDKISGQRYVSKYRYRHGFYDHAEKEFRGFGMVEQTDAESFEHWAKSGATNVTEAALHQEPVITKSWTHLGAYFDRFTLLNQFKDDYWYEEQKRQGFNPTHYEQTLPEAEIIAAPGIDPQQIADLSAEEWREALRACKGMALRTELFANDAKRNGNSPEAIQRALTPYTVEEKNCVIELLQPKGQNRHAVFIVKDKEAITYQYERQPDDPRVSHQFNLKLDEYANVLESVAIVYPRLKVDQSLPTETQKAQAAIWIIASQNRFTNDVITQVHYQLRQPSETSTFEIADLPKKGRYYQFAELNDLLNTSKTEVIEYHEQGKTSTSGKPTRRLIEQKRLLYYRSDLQGPLPQHQLAALALPYESYLLAYTPKHLKHLFGSKVTDQVLLEGKYTHFENDDQWWVRSGIVNYIFGSETESTAQRRFYSPLSYTDPFGATTKVGYLGTQHMFVGQTEDALGNRQRVERFDYRTLSPNQMRDINGNLSAVLADELGLVKALAVMGKGSEADELTGLKTVSSSQERARVKAYFQSVDSTQLQTRGRALLQKSTTRFVYDFEAYSRDGKPVVVASISREQHHKDNPNSPLQLSFEYLDGSGGVLMKKVQAEPGLAKKVVVTGQNLQVTEEDTAKLNPPQLRWRGTGRTIKNNKGNAVKQYEPYFSISHQFEDLPQLVETGVTPVMFYDAASRLVKTEFPDGTLSRVSLNSWSEAFYDANDTVLETDWYKRRTNRQMDAELLAQGKDPGKEKLAADKAALHANTPQIMHLDSLGRPVLSVDHNKNLSTGADEFYSSSVLLDAESNLLKVTDARNNAVMQYQYDMLGNLVVQQSMDAGKRWLLLNIDGKPLRTWDSRKHEFHYTYDILKRPLLNKVLGGEDTSALNHVFERFFYGEDLLKPGRVNEKDLQTKNLLGQPYQYFDTAGRVQIPAYDFKGKPSSEIRTLHAQYKETVNWTDAKLLTDLESQTFTFSNVLDALGRPVQEQNPDGSQVLYTYNSSGAMETQSVKWPGNATPQVFIKNVDYNARGQREKIVYGNGVETRFQFDAQSFRLIRLQSQRQNKDPLQDFRYTYDPAGNITHITDKNEPVVFFNNQKVEAIKEYTYDALYRLVEAKGRENKNALNFSSSDNWNDAGFMQQMNPGDPISVRNYIRQYQYDSVGNMLQMKHQAAGNRWTRNYTYANDNNRLLSTQIGSQVYRYTHHNAHGYMEQMPHLEDLGWSFKEELIRSVRQKRSDGGTPETTYYQYDGQGQRIRKITENQAAPGQKATKKQERIYLRNYELFKQHSGAHSGLKRVSLSLSLMDGAHRFALIETRNGVDDGTEKQLIRYQLDNHQGSASIELDQKARVISYEEYHPFGTTAFQAQNTAIKAVAKRYRYTGMERDEETGLEYHSARYYLPWLGRWMSADPIGIGDGLNVYSYVKNDPIGFIDESGQSRKKKGFWHNFFRSDAMQAVGNTIGSFLSWATASSPANAPSPRTRTKKRLSNFHIIRTYAAVAAGGIGGAFVKKAVILQRLTRSQVRNAAATAFMAVYGAGMVVTKAMHWGPSPTKSFNKKVRFYIDKYIRAALGRPYSTHKLAKNQHPNVIARAFYAIKKARERSTVQNLPLAAAEHYFFTRKTTGVEGLKGAIVGYAFNIGLRGAIYGYTAKKMVLWHGLKFQVRLTPTSPQSPLTRGSIQWSYKGLEDGMKDAAIIRNRLKLLMQKRAKNKSNK